MRAHGAIVGVRRASCSDSAPGELAAACTAGVFCVEDELRFAATPDDPGTVPVDLDLPSLTSLSGAPGRAIASDEILGTEYRRRHAARGPGAVENCVDTLAAGVDVVVEVGLDTALGSKMRAA